MSLLVLYVIVATYSCGALLGWVLTDRRWLEPDRQKLLAEQRKEDCRYCLGMTGFNASREDWGRAGFFHPRIPHPTQRHPFDGVRCEADTRRYVASMQEAVERLGNAFTKLGVTIVT